MSAPSTGAIDGREHRSSVRVYYEDTDFTGLVYHASYVRFLERGRSDLLRALGVDHTAMAALETAFAVVRLEIDFRRPAGIDDALEVVTALADLRGPRLRFAQRVTRGAETLCEASVVVACIDPAGRARRPPPELLAVLHPHLLPITDGEVSAKPTKGPRESADDASAAPR